MATEIILINWRRVAVTSFSIRYLGINTDLLKPKESTKKMPQKSKACHLC